MSKRLNVAERREIFRVLVATQDLNPNVPESRKLIMKKFGISDAQLRQIEEEGIDRDWPPFDDKSVRVRA